MKKPSPPTSQADDLRRPARPARAVLASLGLAAALAGCAGNQVNAQWSDPQFTGQPPRGAKVLVACYAADPTLRRVCADRFAAEVAAQGALPVLAADAGDAPPPADEALLNEARAAGAAALLRTTISADTQVAAPGPSIGIGIGGFGGGYRSGGGVGFGMSAPIGGAGQVATGFAASSSLVDAASGRLMWSGRASAAPSSDVGAQLAALAKLLVDAARQSGQFAR
jgi:hypothetical protein